jgi:hypothetical protein
MEREGSVAEERGTPVADDHVEMVDVRQER